MRIKNQGLCLLLVILLSACVSTEAPAPKAAQKTPPPSSLQKIWEDPEQLFKEAQKNYQAGNYPLAATALERILSVYPKSSVAPESRKMSEELQIRLGSAHVKIGVILPLSGSYARFGEAALDGISCAIGLFDPCGSSTSKAQIVVRDSKGNPSVAAQGVKELVEEEKVSALIGPLLSTEAPGAAAQAQMLRIPMLVLAPQEGVTSAGDFIFQHTLQPQNEVTALVQQAVKSGIKKFIILYPDNPYGKDYQLLFVNEVMNSGAGKVIASKSYSADIPDFNGLVEELKLKPGMQKTGIFIPDSYKQAIEIGQVFDTAALQGPKFLGTSRWYHPLLLSQKINSLEGALIDTAFFPDANRETTHLFSDNFYKTYGNSPAWLEAMAYDATRLLLNALESDPKNSATTQSALLAIQNFPGVVGPLSWNAQRVSKWPLDIVTLREGKFVSVGNP